MPETWWCWPLAVFRYYTCLRCSSGQNTSFGTNRCTPFFGHLCTIVRCKHNPCHTTFHPILEFLVQPWHMHSILADRFVSSLHFHSHPNSSHSCTGNASSSALKWKLHYETKSALYYHLIIVRMSPHTWIFFLLWTVYSKICGMRQDFFLHGGQISCNTTCRRHYSTSSSFQCHKSYAISVATCPF